MLSCIKFQRNQNSLYSCFKTVGVRGFEVLVLNRKQTFTDTICLASGYRLWFDLFLTNSGSLSNHICFRTSTIIVNKVCDLVTSCELSIISIFLTETEANWQAIRVCDGRRVYAAGKRANPHLFTCNTESNTEWIHKLWYKKY